MTRTEAAAKLYRRYRMRGSLTEWCRFVLEPFGQEPAWHHLAIIAKLEALSRGDIDRLMILAPPGSAKSTYVSTLFPAWYLAQHPRSAVIAASHTVELAERFGRRVRAMVNEYSPELGYAMSDDNAAAGRWETSDGSEYFAVGVGGAVSGRRADLLIIDDPVKSRLEADSPLVSQRTWDWWQSDALTRLKPGGKVVLVQTRWTEHDLGGRLEDEMAEGGKQWDILRLPMIAEDNDPLGRAAGEMLWDEWYTADMLAQAKRDARTFSALYQQRPVPDTGGFFKSHWIRPVPTLPPLTSLRTYMGSDYAVTSNGGDYTVHAVIGIDSDERIYLCDLWRGQASSDVWVDAFCDMVLKWKPIGAAEETGQIRSAIGPYLNRRQRERRAFVAREAFPTRGDKSIRAQSFRGKSAADGIYIPADAPWRAEFEAEMLSFPAGKHDDQIDAISLAFQLIDKIAAPATAKPAPRPRDSWDRAFNRDADTGRNWKTA